MIHKTVASLCDIDSDEGPYADFELHDNEVNNFIAGKEVVSIETFPFQNPESDDGKSFILVTTIIANEPPNDIC